MQYLCLAYEEQSKLDALDEEEWEALRQKTLAYVDKLRERGTLVVTRALESATLAKTVRVRDGQMAATDGPFAETKEQLGGIFLIEASSFEEAIAVAADWPSARIGSIEVRPTLETLRTGSRYGPA